MRPRGREVRALGGEGPVLQVIDGRTAECPAPTAAAITMNVAAAMISD